MVTHYDTTGIEIVVEGFALPQELWGKDDIVGVELRTDALGVTHRNGTFDDHNSRRVHLHDLLDNILNGRGVEKVLGTVIVGGRSNHHEVSIAVPLLPIGSGMQIQLQRF